MVETAWVIMQGWLEGFFLKPHSKLFWGFLLLYVPIGFAFYKIIGKLSVIEAVKNLFPKRVYASRSFFVDIINLFAQMYIVTAFIPFGWRLFTGGQMVTTESFLVSHFGYSSVPISANLSVNLLYTFTNFLCFEMAFFAVHYAFHRVPVLWAFHKVHHAALEMSPLTGHRAHICEDIPQYLALGTLLGANLFLFRSLGYHPSVVTMTGGFPVFVLGFLVFENFRHSHIPISFGILNRVFSSPVVHQIHHSTKAEHIDKNFGFYLSIFDWIFGTLALPKKNEDLKFGLAENPNYNPHFFQLYFTQPFVDIWEYVKRGEVLRHNTKINSTRVRGLPDADLADH